MIGWFSSRNPAVPPTFAISVADVFDFSVRPSQRRGENEMSLSLSSVAAVAAAEVERMIVLSPTWLEVRRVECRAEVDVECKYFVSFWSSAIGRCGFVGVSAEQDFRFGRVENSKFERT